MIQVFVFAFLGIVAVSLIATLGAIASRKYSFNYGWLTILSIVVYTTTAYFSSLKTNLFNVLLINLVVGIYDASVGWKLCLYFNAKTDMSDKEIQKSTLPLRLFMMLFFSLGFGYLGYYLSNNNVI